MNGSGNWACPSLEEELLFPEIAKRKAAAAAGLMSKL